MAGPIPIAVRLDSGVTLRGHEWSVDGMPILFVHDLGEDLDVWGPTPARLAGAGFRVVSMELRGHGLSEGEADASSVREDIAGIVGEVAGSFGPVALVVHGAAAESAFFMSEASGAPVQIVVSPQPLDPGGIAWGDTARAMRLVLMGANNDVVREYVESIYPKLRGQNLLASTGTKDQGPALLAAHPTLVEQAVMFIRRYLTGFHLGWIAQHADEIKAASERGGE